MADKMLIKTRKFAWFGRYTKEFDQLQKKIISIQMDQGFEGEQIMLWKFQWM